MTYSYYVPQHLSDGADFVPLKNRIISRSVHRLIAITLLTLVQATTAIDPTGAAALYT